MRTLEMHEPRADWWEIPALGERPRRRSWRAGVVRAALLMEAALLVLCLFVATVAKDESAELFFTLAVLGTPLVALVTVALLVFRYVTAGRRSGSRAAGDDRECRCPIAAHPPGARQPYLPAPELSADQRLRRRYVAGDIGDSEFQVGMMVLAKERFTRGHLSLSEYELELDRLLDRARAAAVPATGAPSM